MNKKWITLLFSFSLCFCMSCSDSESDKKEEGKVEEEKPGMPHGGARLKR